MSSKYSEVFNPSTACKPIAVCQASLFSALSGSPCFIYSSFITCNGRAAAHGTRQEIAAALLDPKAFAVGTQQLSLDDFTPKVLPDAAPAVQKLAAAGMPARQAAYEVKQEALQCLTRRM